MVTDIKRLAAVAQALQSAKSSGTEPQAQADQEDKASSGTDKASKIVQIVMQGVQQILGGGDGKKKSEGGPPGGASEMA